MNQKIAGFTLMELMITLAIIAIIATVAMPNYSRYVQRGDRSDAIASMHAIMAAQERYYGDNVSYTNDLKDLGYTDSTFTTPKAFYVISARVCSDSEDNDTPLAFPLTQCVELIATAQNNQASDGNLVINSYGRQDRRLPDGSLTDW